MQNLSISCCSVCIYTVLPLLKARGWPKHAAVILKFSCCSVTWRNFRVLCWSVLQSYSCVQLLRIPCFTPGARRRAVHVAFILRNCRKYTNLPSKVQICSPGAVTLQHYNTAALQHYNTAALQHNTTTLLRLAFSPHSVLMFYDFPSEQNQGLSAILTDLPLSWRCVFSEVRPEYYKYWN
jgi:hypothetical protein